MITEKGQLPIGIERDGKFHRDFVLRPALVKDTIEVVDEHDAAKLKNSAFFGVCLTAKQIVRVGDITPVTTDMALEMLDIDLDEIGAAKERLASRLASFHSVKTGGDRAGGADSPGADQAAPQAHPDVAQNENPV